MFSKSSALKKIMPADFVDPGDVPPPALVAPADIPDITFFPVISPVAEL